MIDPITIGLVISGAKALKSAFDTAKEAMDEIRACAESGVDAKHSMGSLVKFFTAQGEVKKALIESKQPAAEADASSSQRSATAIALEAMQYEMQLQDDEEEIKTYLIYKCKQSGLYDDLCRRRDAIANARAEQEAAARAAETERLLAEKRRQMAIRRKRQQRIDLIIDTISLLLGAIACTVLIYGIYWMFQQG